MSEALRIARAHVVANSGSTQFALLVREGLCIDSRVLEYGCGMLDTARWLIPYLEQGTYVGVDPNEWVPRAAMDADEQLSSWFQRAKVRLLDIDDFDIPADYGAFDYIFAHSVLSHAADHQLTQFLKRASLRPGGKILASIRLADSDSNDAGWVYPGVSYFTKATVEKRARAFGLATCWRPEYRELMVREHPDEYHDWVMFKRFER